MAELFEGIRERATKAAFEADKLRRITQVRATIRGLRKELERKRKEIGDSALQLYDAGQLTQPQLVELCEQLAPLRNQIREKEAKIESIRKEKPPEAPTPALYGHVCPRCKIKFPEEVDFCPRCGTKIENVPPPATSICPQCGAALVEGSAFCSSCGAEVEQASESHSTET